jgi:carbonic anhydrase/acetyltransferase-like protein (isoleucine patch superfamily)
MDVSKGLRTVWYGAARCVDEALAAITSQTLSIWLVAATGRRSRRIRADGVPRIRMHPRGTLHVGDDVRLISKYGLNAVGGHDAVTLWIGPGATLSIGSRSGLSHATIVCLQRIEIGCGVLIGGGARIFDSDFHMAASPTTITTKRLLSLPVRIEDDVFVGAYATILKGVTVGRGAVIGAGSVVTRNIPAHEVWAGNPARKLEFGPKTLERQQ